MKTRRLARWLSKTVRLTKRQRQQLIEALNVPSSADPADRHPAGQDQAPTSTPLLGGLVEADEVLVRRSAKGRKAERLVLGRLPRKRGEPSAKGSGRRLSEHQPVLMARARTGEAAAALLPGLASADFQATLTAMVDAQAILITDALPALQHAAAQTNRHHEVLNVAAHEYCRGAFHGQTVGSTHQRFRKFLVGHSTGSAPPTPRTMSGGPCSSSNIKGHHSL